MTTSLYSVMASPVGELTLRWANDALVGVYFENHLRIVEERARWTRDDATLAPVRAQLEEYFRGERTTFDLPLAPAGTPFQQRAWLALRAIPFGETRSYGEQARAIGEREWAAARAVGAANGRNPIAIVVPCHRVIGANGSLTGFGGGLPAKRWLLAHEGVRLDEVSGAARSRRPRRASRSASTPTERQLRLV